MTQLAAHHHCRYFRRLGFSLVELLIVMSIIALLVGILFPVFSKVRESSRRTTCSNNLAQIGRALELYANDNRGWYPRALPLVDGNRHSDRNHWLQPWDPNLPPDSWQIGYAAMLVPYMSVPVHDPFDYANVPDQFDLKDVGFLSCPSNDLPLEPEIRKHDYPLDYGMANQASQNRQNEVLTGRHFLFADMTWAMAYVPDSGGPHAGNTDLQDWWVVFVHTGETAQLLDADLAVSLFDKAQFIQEQTLDPPDGDDL